MEWELLLIPPRLVLRSPIPASMDPVHCTLPGCLQRATELLRISNGRGVKAPYGARCFDHRCVETLWGTLDGVRWDSWTGFFGME